MKLPTPFVKALQEMEQIGLQADADADRRNKNYSSTIFENGMRWRYFEIRVPGSRPRKIVRYCYTTTRNCTGCFLSFTETITGTKKMRCQRSAVAPHDTRREARAWALKIFRKEKEARIAKTTAKQLETPQVQYAE